MCRPAEPRQVRHARERRHRRLVAIEHVPAQQDGAGDPGRGAPPDEGRQREGHRPGRERDETDPQGEPDRGLGRDLVAGQRGERRSGHPRTECGHDHDDRHPGQVGEQLLDGDPAESKRRDRDELEAAAARFGGKGAGQGKDRPQRGDQADRGAGLPGDRTTKRLDAGRERVAVDPGHDRRQACDEGRQLRPRLGRGVRLAEGGAAREEQGADQAGDDDDREPRVAQRLGVDAAEAVDAAPGRRRSVQRRSAVMTPSPPRPRGRTGRGRSPRGSARGSRSRAARSGPRPGRPA